MSNAIAFESHVGESLLTRNQFLNSFKQLGPPDHLHIINCEKDVNAGDKTDDYKQSCFMHLVGLDNSSVSSMAATIARLLTSQNLKAWFDQQTVIRGTLSTFNPFSAIDVRVQVSLPGGVHSYGINQEDKEISIEKFQEIFWHEIYVVSVLRSYSLPTPVSSTLGPLFRENVFPDDRAIVKFLKSAYFVYSHSSASFAVHSMDGNFLISYVKSILNDLGRSDLLQKWLDGSLMGVDPLLSDTYVKLAQLQSLLAVNQESVAFNKLQHLFTEDNEDDMLSLLYFEYSHLLKNKNFKQCAKVAQLIVYKHPSHAESWINYANALFELEQYEQALIALNSCPMNNFEDDPKIEFYRTLKPNARYCHVREHVDILEQLTLIPDGSDSNFLQHSKLFQSLPPILKDAHLLLAKMTNILTWDGLLKLRNRVFVMELNEEMVEMSEGQKRLCEKWLDDLFLMLYDDLRVYLVIKNELKKNPNTQYKQNEWYHFGLICHRLHKYEDVTFAFEKVKSNSPTVCLKLVNLLILEYSPNIWKVDRNNAQIGQIYKLYKRFMTTINTDSYEVYFDVYGCDNYKDPFYHYMIELCKIHGVDLVQVWILQSAMTKEERRLMEDLFKYTTKLQIQ